MGPPGVALPAKMGSLLALAQVSRSPCVGGMLLGASADVTTPRFAAVCLLAIATPFETRQPIMNLPFQQLTLTEVVWLGVAAVWIGHHAWTRRWPAWRTPITKSWLVWIAAMIVAAAVTDSDRANAFKTTARLIVTGLTAWMVATSVSTPRRLVGLLAVAAATGIVVAVFAALEVGQVPVVLASLDRFRDGMTLVGGALRASSTLQYPTIAAMYLELVLCGSVGVLLWTGETKGWGRAWVGILIVATLALGLSLTLTRAAVVAAVAGVAAAGWGRYRRHGMDRGVALAVACAVCIGCSPIVAAPLETVRARWTTDGRQGWYRAAFEAPASVTGQPGALAAVPVSVTNLGKIAWASSEDSKFALSYHWMEAASTRVVEFDGARTRLSADVPPGTRLPVMMEVRFPRKPGHYRIAWDAVLEHRLWFGAEPGAETTFTAASVIGDPAVGAPTESARARQPPTYLPSPAQVPGRPVLWHVAMRMAADHPWFGVGPDNFRWGYGHYLGDPGADTNVHSNNMYLEVLTGGGVLAAIPFGWFLWRTVVLVRNVSLRLSGAAEAAYTGVIGAWVAYLVHGCLDSFLTFTPTALASAMVVGLAMAPLTWKEFS